MLQQPIESAQYARAQHQVMVAKYGLVGSMSRKGNCWDNAVMERFWHRLKVKEAHGRWRAQ